MNLYEVDNGEVTDANEINLYTTNNRILIKGENKINISDGMMEATGLLIRSDMQDFVIMTGENEALRFTKEELEGMFSMLSMFSDDDEADVSIDSDTDFKYTNEVRTLQGMKATELQIYHKNKKGHISIWLTNELDIDWGMLTRPWTNVPAGMNKSVNKVTQEFQSRNFPLLVEVFEQDANYTIFEVTQVKKSRIARDMVELPPNIELLSLQTLIMKAMMNR